MSLSTRLAAALIGLALAMASGNPAAAQKRGGILKMYFFDSPASMSIHEEATIAGQGPMMGVFNNLVMYKQDVPQARLDSSSGPGERVVVARGRQGTDLQIAPGRHLA